MCDSPRDGMETEPKTSPMAESKLAVDMVEKGEVAASSSSSGFMGAGLRLLTAAALRDMSGAASCCCCCCCHGGDCLQVSTRNFIMTTAEVLRWGGRSDSDVTTPAILLHPPPATWKLTISHLCCLFCSFVHTSLSVLQTLLVPIFERVKHKSMTATEAESANTEQTDHLQEPAPGTHSIST